MKLAELAKEKEMFPRWSLAKRYGTTRRIINTEFRGEEVHLDLIGDVIFDAPWDLEVVEVATVFDEKGIWTVAPEGKGEYTIYLVEDTFAFCPPRQ